jgi:hypothetical protein
MAPLFPIDAKLFNIKAKNPKDITACVCERLMSKGLKSDLINQFCAVP